MSTRKPCPGCGAVSQARPVNGVCRGCASKLKEAEFHRQKSKGRVCEWATVPRGSWDLGHVPYQPFESRGPNEEFLALVNHIAVRDPSSGVASREAAKVAAGQRRGRPGDPGGCNESRSIREMPPVRCHPFERVA